MRRGPLQFEEQHRVIAHATSAPEEGVNRRVQRLDDPEADRMIAIGGDAVETATSDPKNHPQVIEVLLTELGQVDLGLRGAPRERTRLRHRAEVAIGWRCLGVGRQGRLRGHGVFAALGQNLFDLGVRAGNDVY